MTSLLSLAERCEAATEEDERWCVIEALVLAHKSGWLTDNKYDQSRSWVDAGAFESAALTLVPEGWSHLMAWNARGCVCDVHSRPLGDFDGTWPAHARAATPALALCAAALKARAETESSHEHD